MFSKYLVVHEHCPVCGAKLGAGDSGDAPMVFIILILGAVVVGAAITVEVKYAPPLWLHAALWVPTILAGTLALMPLFKSVFYALTYHYDAREHVEVKDPEQSK